MEKDMIRLAIVGAGPAGLMVFNKIMSSNQTDFEIDIFESSDELGSGMPYSARGALREHITNVSADELPELVKQLDDWVLQLPDEVLKEYDIERDKFHEKKVVPRLLFGRYLGSQFKTLLASAKARGIKVTVHSNSKVVDVIDLPDRNMVQVQTEKNGLMDFDCAVLCTGHQWEKEHELTVSGYYDSPYPPSKLAQRFNHTIVVRGSSLTAIDALKTMARSNGKFYWEGEKYRFKPFDESPDFHIEMHSRDGLLPSVRMHMEEPHVDSKSLIPVEKLEENMRQNNGFLELDFLYQEGFVKPLEETDPKFFEQIKHMSLEQFVEKMMSYRENTPAFELLREEYSESIKSIRKEEAIPWKEMLGSLSFAMNYPAKHLSAEDMLRMREHLSPLISVVIAFVPQSSCETLLALHEAGCLEMVTDGKGGEVKIDADGKIVYVLKTSDGKHTETICQTFVDCIGQKHMNVHDFPFKTLKKHDTISGARLKFASSEKAKELQTEGNKEIECEDGIFYLQVPGVAINDNFQILDKAGRASEQIYLMAVPHIGGFNPDYSGLDFCEQASKRIVNNIIATTNSEDSLEEPAA